MSSEKEPPSPCPTLVLTHRDRIVQSPPNRPETLHAPTPPLWRDLAMAQAVGGADGSRGGPIATCRQHHPNFQTVVQFPVNALHAAACALGVATARTISGLARLASTCMVMKTGSVCLAHGIPVHTSRSRS